MSKTVLSEETRPKPDPYAADPFFRRKLGGGTWNACIGKQGDEENYLDGYIEASIELVAAVIDKKMLAKRDTLVLPILYNTRHAVELILKFMTDRLVAANVIPYAGPPDHDIQAYWDRLHAAELGDEKLAQHIEALKPFVESLARIDDDGQELRYHLTRSKDPSLSDYSIANFEVIRESLGTLAEIISVLKYRTMSYLDERASGTFTARCSRRDLLAIAQIMPRREFWKAPLFDQQKAVVKARFKLSNTQFCKVLDAIQANTEMNAILGVESELLHLTDDEIVWVVEQWRRIHPVEDEGDGEIVSGLDYFSDERFEEMQARMQVASEAVDAVTEKITGDKLAELEAMFYLGRDRFFPEWHPKRVERTRKEHALAGNPVLEVDHLMQKTNFLHSTQQAAVKLGRLKLAERLASM